MKYYLLRIVQDKVKLTVALTLLMIPAMEVVQIAWHVHQGFSIPIPHYATFLSCYTIRHYLHKIMFWFLPLFLLIIVNEDSIEDTELRYRNLQIVRMGKRCYLKTKLVGSFCVAFLIIFLGLMLNMLLVYLCFQNGTFNKDEGLTTMVKDIEIITKSNPVIANFIYIVMTSFLSGLLAMTGTVLAITLQDRKIVYGMTFLLWFIPVMSKNSIMYVIQPFIGVNYELVIPTLLGVIFSYTIIIVTAIILEVRDNEL